MGECRRPGGWLTIDLTGLDRLPVAFAAAPHATALALGMGAVGRPDLGGPPAQRAAIRLAMSDSTVRVFATLAHPRTFPIWDGLAPWSAPPSHGWQPQFELASTDIGEFQAEIEENYGRAPSHWSSVLRTPRRFLSDYVRACREIWSAVRPMLGDTSVLLNREAERVGRAAVCGTVPELLASLYPGATLADGRLRLPARRSQAIRLAPAGLAIGPTLAAQERGGYAYRDGQLLYLTYPMPRLGPFRRGDDRAAGRPERDSRNELISLLGPPRATLLRFLDRPASAGELATLLHCGPSAVTYHVDALVAAGLVRRERLGRQVLVQRTDRGDQILELYAS